MLPSMETWPWQDSVALTGDDPGSPPVTVRFKLLNSTESASKETEPPLGSPSVICTSLMCGLEIVGEFEVPAGITALSPLSGTLLGVQFAAVSQWISVAPV